MPTACAARSTVFPYTTLFRSSLDECIDDAVHGAFGGLAAEEAGHAQHKSLGNFEREPLSKQLRRRVHTSRIRRILLRVGAGAPAVEDKNGTVMNERGVSLSRCAREHAHAERVRAERRP